MEKKYIIGGLAIAAIGGYYLYNKNQKEKAAKEQQLAMDATQRAKAKTEADALAAKNQSDQIKTMTDMILKQADIDVIPYNIPIQTANGMVMQIPNVDYDKLKRTVSSGILSFDELKSLYNGALNNQNKYIGTMTRQQIADAINKVYDKYKITQSSQQSLNLTGWVR